MPNVVRRRPETASEPELPPPTDRRHDVPEWDPPEHDDKAADEPAESDRYEAL
jgi:hypothetical protein